MTPIRTALEQNQHMNVLVEAYTGNPLDDTLNLGKKKEPSIQERSESVEDETENGWKKRSRRLSGIFRRG